MGFQEALIEGLIPTIVGMGVVFSFLVILIIGMYITTFCIKIINRICPEPVKEIAPIRVKASFNDEEVAVAILMAHLN